MTIINGFKRNTKNISQYACPTQAVRKDAHTRHEDDKAGRATGGRAGADHRMDARRQVIDPGTFEFLFPKKKVLSPKNQIIIKKIMSSIVLII